MVSNLGKQVSRPIKKFVKGLNNKKAQKTVEEIEADESEIQAIQLKEAAEKAAEIAATKKIAAVKAAKQMAKQKALEQAAKQAAAEQLAAEKALKQAAIQAAANKLAAEKAVKEAKIQQAKIAAATKIAVAQKAREAAIEKATQDALEKQLTADKAVKIALAKQKEAKQAIKQIATNEANVNQTAKLLAKRQAESEKLINTEKQLKYKPLNIKRKSKDLTDKSEYVDFNSLSVPDNYKTYRGDYGYSFLPPEHWYPQAPKAPVCVTDKKCPVCPITTTGYPLDVKEWDTANNVLPDDQFKTNN